MKRLNILITDEQYQDLLDIKQKRNHFRVIETIRYCISETHAKHYKEYIEVQKARLARPVLTEVDKAEAKWRAKENLEQAKINADRAAKTALCQRFDEGEVAEHPETGRLVCQYPSFQEIQGGLVEKTMMMEPLDLINEELLQYQYSSLLLNGGPEAKARVLEQIAKNGIVT